MKTTKQISFPSAKISLTQTRSANDQVRRLLSSERWTSTAMNPHALIMTIRSPKRKLNYFTNQQALFIVLVNQINLIPLLIRQNRTFKHRLKNEV